MCWLKKRHQKQSTLYEDWMWECVGLWKHLEVVWELFGKCIFVEILAIKQLLEWSDKKRQNEGDVWSNWTVGQVVIKFRDKVAWKLINWKHVERDWTKSNEMYKCLEWEGVDLIFIY